MMRAVRPFIALSGAATVAAAIVLVQLPTAQAGPAHPAAAADRGAALSSAARSALNAPAAPGSTDLTNLGASGWAVRLRVQHRWPLQASAKATSESSVSGNSVAARSSRFTPRSW